MFSLIDIRVRYVIRVLFFTGRQKCRMFPCVAMLKYDEIHKIDNTKIFTKFT